MSIEMVEQRLNELLRFGCKEWDAPHVRERWQLDVQVYQRLLQYMLAEQS